VTIAVTLEQHLGRNGVTYDLLSHTATTSSLHTVEASHVPADALAIKMTGGIIFALD
jgi:hypothetical protein